MRIFAITLSDCFLTIWKKSGKIWENDNNVEGECSRMYFPAREKLSPAESSFRVQIYYEVRHRSCFLKEKPVQFRYDCRGVLSLRLEFGWYHDAFVPVGAGAFLLFSAKVMFASFMVWS